jgi:hypothetical protein
VPAAVIRTDHIAEQRSRRESSSFARRGKISETWESSITTTIAG